MSFIEWHDRFGHHSVRTGPHTLAVHCMPNDPGYSDLYNLTDYAVESSQAGVTWLRPRTPVCVDCGD